MSSYFYLQTEEDLKNTEFIKALEEYSTKNKELIYVLDRPLTDQRYDYTFESALIVLSPKHKAAILKYGGEDDDFEDYHDDVVEDLASISDKYGYKEVIGRSRKWRQELIEAQSSLPDPNRIENWLESIELSDDLLKKKQELLISLFIGSINDIDRVKEGVPESLLDKVKQKIQLFDADQTKFVYQSLEKKKVRIQGLSGTGKTELLLHKLKDLYITDPESRIYFTCHNKILADSLRKRIPQFFNFMKVEQQIEWEKRLWCTNAWGSMKNVHSGAYRHICYFYDIPFYKYSQMSFSGACEAAVNEILLKFDEADLPKAFTYMFIDESQDFDENFFDLCELVTEKKVYVAGDIFQSIFDQNISGTIEPDFLLGKCYRTDPKTLMFAHGLGMGLFEENKLRWLEKKEWQDCGYGVTISDNKYHLSREPSRRFEDLDPNYESIRIVQAEKSFSDTIIDLIKEIRIENESVNPNDIGIIFLDSTQDKDIYSLADRLEAKCAIEFGWSVNKAYESKEEIPNTILISNRNNVKGLEFPFVICVTKRIIEGQTYRNSIYTMLTRSFLKSYFVTQHKDKSGITEGMIDGLHHIVSSGEMVIEEPSEDEKDKIRTRFEYNSKKLSFFDMMTNIFDEFGLEDHNRTKLLLTAQDLGILQENYEDLRQFVSDHLKYL